MDLGFKQLLRDLRDRRYRFRQVLSGAFGLVLITQADPGGWPLIAGWAACIAGVLVRGWAAGYVRKSKVLERRGPYAFVRHPQYLGNTLIAIGLSFATRVWWGIPVWGLLLWLFYLPAIRREDRKLKGRFGEEWEEWRSRRPAVLPIRPPSREPGISLGGWSPRQYLRNGEPAWTLLVAGGLVYLAVYAPG